MAMNFNLGQILSQYVNQPQPTGHEEQDFDEVARNADPDDLRQGLSEAFHSDRTPPFGNMVGQLFNQADLNQRTGMINHLLSVVGPAVIGPLLGGSTMGGSGPRGGIAGAVGGLLGRLSGAQHEQLQLSPDQVAQLTPQQVEQIGNLAEREDPNVIDRMAEFYARNPTLFKALGGMAMAIALGKIAQTRH